VFFSFREYPPTGGLCRIILDLNFDRGRFHGTPGQRGAWIRHDPAFGIAPQFVGCEARHSRLCGELLNNMPGKRFSTVCRARMRSGAIATPSTNSWTGTAPNRGFPSARQWSFGIGCTWSHGLRDFKIRQPQDRLGDSSLALRLCICFIFMVRGLHGHGLIMRPPASKFSPVGALSAPTSKRPADRRQPHSPP
jgi:hypothetical protein